MQDATHFTLAAPWPSATESGVSYDAHPTESVALDLLANVADLVDSFGPLRTSAAEFSSLIDERADETLAARDTAVAIASTVTTARDQAVAARDTSVAQATIATTKAGEAVAARDTTVAAKDLAVAKADDAANSAIAASDFADAAAASAAEATASDPANFVLKAGSTMTGALTLSGAPSASLHATTKAYVDARSGVSTVAGRSGAVLLTKSDVGLANVDNTSDLAKPISTATQTALNGKAASVHTHAIADVTNLQSTLDGKLSLSGGQMTGTLELRTSSPTVYMRDTDGNSAMLHTNSNFFYVLRGGSDTNVWTQVNGQWPLSINLTSNDINFGGHLYANDGNLYVNKVGGGGEVRLRGNGSPAWRMIGPAGSGAGDMVFQFSSDNFASNFFEALRLSPSGESNLNGRAFPKKADGGALNFYWSGQSGQPSWLWGGNDGNNMYVYNPSNFSVNYATSAGNANTVGGIVQGNLIKRSQDASLNGAWSRQIVVAGNDNTNEVWSCPIEIREVGLVGNADISTSRAPGIVFHHSSVAATALKMYNDASLRVQAQGNDAAAYRPIFASDHYASGWFRSLTDTGLYWEGRGRGLTVADNGANYGNVNIYGNGLNGWQGYSINNSATFMANSDTRGIYNQSAGHWCVQWDQSGNATFPANVTAYSDERLKQNKRPIDNIDARIAGMAQAAMLYERDGETRIGFGAQTLEQSVPEVVRTADDLAGTKSVNYSDLVAVLAVKVAELTAKLEALEAKK
ncbi:hypothetical protein PX699_00150 [Sphingobium sp. H39-3-25]|uniref:hypothetical protein n=1 Tax=Sphingobium arseniciresistens TaxID=3030834 RepID=UPI0023B9D10B|nr:hypothetical protein [Sphingobium arseniciresistens]